MAEWKEEVTNTGTTYLLHVLDFWWTLIPRGEGDWDLDGPMYDMVSLGYIRLSREQAQTMAYDLIRAKLRKTLKSLK